MSNSWRIGVALVLALFVVTDVAQAQPISFGRVTRTAETIEEAQPFRLGRLQPGDVVEVHIRRLSGDLIPYAAIYNQSTDRYAIRLEANADNPARLDATYTIEAEAGEGEFTLRVTSDLEHETTGDFVVSYETRRGNIVLNSPSAIITRELLDTNPLILVEDTALKYAGIISATVWQVDYLVYLNTVPPVAITVTTVDGDLQPFLGVSPASEVSYFIRAFGESGSASAVFPPPGREGLSSGYYVITVSRVDLDAGTTTGRFELSITPVLPSEG